jgi:prepilin-type N-terminal cleavage/methylation domain-containing protein
MNKSRGFSIVEITIVIIVVGILSTIIGAVYLGAQNNARTAQYRTDVEAIAKRAEIAAGDNDGQFPLTAADFVGTAKIDNDKNITISSVLNSSQSAPSSNSSLPTPPAYVMHVCNNTRAGVRIYFPNLDKSSVDYAESGKWSAGC